MRLTHRCRMSFEARAKPRPGTSTRRKRGSAGCPAFTSKKSMVFVLPGLEDVGAMASRPRSMFTSEDFPTLLRPAKTTSGTVSSGALGRSQTLQIMFTRFTTLSPMASYVKESLGTARVSIHSSTLKATGTACARPHDLSSSLKASVRPSRLTWGGCSRTAVAQSSSNGRASRMDSTTSATTEFDSTPCRNCTPSRSLSVVMAAVRAIANTSTRSCAAVGRWRKSSTFKAGWMLQSSA
mmetsp:Transcript_33414/g.77593  ORF Transcript_33414/g.77593 Transcript_33414/m.77593 type:complete len:238 (+) Transcript_33414:655-1368(+)